MTAHIMPEITQNEALKKSEFAFSEQINYPLNKSRQIVDTNIVLHHLGFSKVFLGYQGFRAEEGGEKGKKAKFYKIRSDLL